MYASQFNSCMYICTCMVVTCTWCCVEWILLQNLFYIRLETISDDVIFKKLICVPGKSNPEKKKKKKKKTPESMKAGNTLALFRSNR